jgi:hypothetical protein
MFRHIILIMITSRKFSNKIAALVGAGVLSAVTVEASPAKTLINSTIIEGTTTRVISFDVTSGSYDNSWTYSEEFFFCGGLYLSSETDSVKFSSSAVTLGTTLSSSDFTSTVSEITSFTLGASSTDYSYVGFEYLSDGGDSFYGYLQYSYYNDGSNKLTFVGYAFESEAGSSINVTNVTSVPESSSTSVVLGGIGLLTAGAGMVRRAKKNA